MNNQLPSRLKGKDSKEPSLRKQTLLHQTAKRRFGEQPNVPPPAPSTRETPEQSASTDARASPDDSIAPDEVDAAGEPEWLVPSNYSVMTTGAFPMCEPPEWCDTDIPDSPTRDDIWARCAEWASIDGTCDEVWRDEVAEGIIAQITAHVAGEDVRVDDREKRISPFEGEYVLRGPLIRTIKWLFVFMQDLTGMNFAVDLVTDPKSEFAHLRLAVSYGHHIECTPRSHHINCPWPADKWWIVHCSKTDEVEPSVEKLQIWLFKHCPPWGTDVPLLDWDRAAFEDWSMEVSREAEEKALGNARKGKGKS